MVHARHRGGIARGSGGAAGREDESQGDGGSGCREGAAAYGGTNCEHGVGLSAWAHRAGRARAGEQDTSPAPGGPEAGWVLSGPRDTHLQQKASPARRGWATTSRWSEERGTGQEGGRQYGDESGQAARRLGCSVACGGRDACRAVRIGRVGGPMSRRSLRRRRHGGPHRHAVHHACRCHDDEVMALGRRLAGHRAVASPGGGHRRSMHEEQPEQDRAQGEQPHAVPPVPLSGICHA